MKRLLILLMLAATFAVPVISIASDRSEVDVNIVVASGDEAEEETNSDNKSSNKNSNSTLGPAGVGCSASGLGMLAPLLSLIRKKTPASKV